MRKCFTHCKVFLLVEKILCIFFFSFVMLSPLATPTLCRNSLMLSVVRPLQLDIHFSGPTSVPFLLSTVLLPIDAMSSLFAWLNVCIKRSATFHVQRKVVRWIGRILLVVTMSLYVLQINVNRGHAHYCKFHAVNYFSEVQCLKGSNVGARSSRK